jgi:hypothetical protein
LNSLPDPPEIPAVPPPATAGGAVTAGGNVTASGAATQAPLQRPLLALGVAVAVVLLAYLAVAVPASWFPSSPVKQWTVRDLTLPRGTGSVANNELVITGPDNAGQVYVAVTTDLRARDYATITWNVRNLPSDAVVHFLWRSDYASRKIFSVPVAVDGGRLLPIVLANDAGWLGHVTGIGLSIRGTLVQPFGISGAAAKPSGALGVVQDRVGEWLAFERWTGTSINSIAGGDDLQPLSLPLVLATSIVLAAAFLLLRRRFRPAHRGADVALAIAIMFAVSWLVLDARWTWNLVRQVQATTAQYGGKDWRGKHLAAEDGPLFEFVEKARAEMPATPARIFVASEADYFRERAAYHLYPHNVYAEPRRNDLPTADKVKPGDWMLVYQRRNVQFNPATGELRWDGGTPVSAELKLRGDAAALFLIK